MTRPPIPPGPHRSAPASSAEAAEIEALKKEVQELSQKVSALEQQRELEQQTNAATPTRNKSRTWIKKCGSSGASANWIRRRRPRPPKPSPALSLGANGFSFGSADSNFVVALHGVLQVDSRTFEQNDNVPGNDSFLLRRARPILSGTVFRDFDFLFVPDFGNGTPGASSSATTPSIYDAYVNYRYSPAFQIQAGKFKAPVGLEQLQAGCQHLVQ